MSSNSNSIAGYLSDQSEANDLQTPSDKVSKIMCAFTCSSWNIRNSRRVIVTIIKGKFQGQEDERVTLPFSAPNLSIPGSILVPYPGVYLCLSCWSGFPITFH